ncbi:MAG TPA: YcxB family protein [Thermoanaerobaculia bacterium]|nr:YcxB family protein [Thermoanaerobaculia bacterium]
MNARTVWYFRSTFGRVLSAVFVLFAILTVVDFARGENVLARSHVLPLFILLVIPFAVRFAGINAPAIQRYIEAPVVYTFSHNGVHIRMSRADAMFLWSELTRAFDSRELLVIVGGGAFQILPKRDLTAEQTDAIRALLREHLAKRFSG